IIETSFLKRVKIYRAHLFKEFNNITAIIYDKSNYIFIEYLIAICVKYICLKYINIFNFIFFNKLLNSFIKK
ncbi:hypothetical protein EMPG_15745, partial [Blastomyces silverae]